MSKIDPLPQVAGPDRIEGLKMRKRNMGNGKSTYQKKDIPDHGRPLETYCTCISEHGGTYIICGHTGQGSKKPRSRNAYKKNKYRDFPRGRSLLLSVPWVPKKGSHPMPALRGQRNR